MLKIKYNVNMSILEKYGFKKEIGTNDNYKYIDWDNHFYINELDEEYPENERKISCEYCTAGFGFNDNDLDIIYYLIKDGLVEKVEE